MENFKNFVFKETNKEVFFNNFYKRIKLICLWLFFIAAAGSFQTQLEAVTYITNADLQSGTYRIKTPGTYVIAEDITFNGKLASDGSTRTDIPLNGAWFAAISIETDNVTIDGGGHLLQESQSYIDRTPIGVFSLISLGNNLFAGVLINTGGAVYPDTTAYLAANNVKISNLRLGLSSAFGIRGSNNNNVTIDKLIFNDIQGASINLQSPQNLKISNSIFFGSKKPIKVNMEAAILVLMRGQFQQLIASNVSGAAEQYAKLNNFVAQNPTRFSVSRPYPSTLYGIIITTGVTTVFRFPMNSNNKPIGESFTDGRPAKDIAIKNCIFYDFQVTGNERVTLSTKAVESVVGLPFISIPLVFAGLFGQMEWGDAFDANGQYNPNEYVKSIDYLFNRALPSLQAIPLFPPAPAFQNIVSSILAGPSGETLFNSSTDPLPGNGDDGNYLKGLFGIRMVGASNVTISNVVMNNFKSSGPQGIDPVTLPGYNSLPPGSNRELTRYRGNDNWFMSFEVSDHVNIDSVVLSGLNSSHGYTFGIDLANEDSFFNISNVSIDTLSSPNTQISHVTDLGDVFGIHVENETGPVKLNNILIRKLSGTGEINALPAASGNVTLTNTKYIP